MSSIVACDDEEVVLTPDLKLVIVDGEGILVLLLTGTFVDVWMSV